MKVTKLQVKKKRKKKHAQTHTKKPTTTTTTNNKKTHSSKQTFMSPYKNDLCPLSFPGPPSQVRAGWLRRAERR